MSCPSCGSGNAPGAAFCAQCGGRLAPGGAPPPGGLPFAAGAMAPQAYRPAPTTTDAAAEMARLAAQGQQRLLQASAVRHQKENEKERRERRERERIVRWALAGFFTLPRVIALVILLVLAAAPALVLPPDDAIGTALTVLVVGLSMSWMVPNRVSRARVAREQAWAASCPFRLEGYFETLGGGCRDECLKITLVWSDPRLLPGPEVVRGLFGIIDTEAELQDSGWSIHSDDDAEPDPSAKGSTIWVRSRSFKSNKQVARYVHSLVDQVLLPLHRSNPLTRVSIAIW